MRKFSFSNVRSAVESGQQNASINFGYSDNTTYVVQYFYPNLINVGGVTIYPASNTLSPTWAIYVGIMAGSALGTWLGSESVSAATWDAAIGSSLKVGFVGSAVNVTPGSQYVVAVAAAGTNATNYRGMKELNL